MERTFHYYDIYFKGECYTNMLESQALAEAEILKYIDEGIDEGDHRNREDFEIRKSDKTFESDYCYSPESNESTQHTLIVEYTHDFIDVDVEETLILALLENDDNAVQYLRKYIKDIRLANESC